jgi:hypothetical protein
MNDYGIYALVGSTTTKLSNELDAIFPLIDFTQPVSGGQVLINNILCAAWSFTYNDTSTLEATARQVQAVFFDKRWFFTSQGALTYVASIPANGVISLYGTTSTGLYKLYNSTTVGANATIRSALWPLGDPIRDKQALKAAIEITTTAAGTFAVTIDNESRPNSIGTFASYATWVNNLGNPITWTNSSNATISWYNNGYTLYKRDAQQYGKYLGLTISTSGALFTLNTLELEYELRARF